MDRHTEQVKKASSLNPPRLTTVSRAAVLLAISERTAWRLVSTGELDVVKIGRATRIKVESIDHLIERGGAA